MNLSRWILMRVAPRLSLVLCATTALLITAHDAHADTNIAGGSLSGNTTWSIGGSPYFILGDVTIPAGSTLTIDAGVEVKAAANSDAQASELDAHRVELIVNGTLHVAGTAANPVTFRSSAPTAGSWYGIVVGADATDIGLDYANITEAINGVTSSAAIGVRLGAPGQRRRGPALYTGTP